MIAAIENGVLAHLEQAPAEILGYAWKNLESSPDDWDVAFKEQMKGTRSPAAWIGFTGWDKTSIQDSGQVFVEGARFALVVMAQNLRNEKSSRHGGVGGEPGSYQLMLDVTAALAHRDLDLPIAPFRIGAAREVARSPELRNAGYSIFALQLTTDFWIDPQATEEYGSFELFHADWDVPAFGNVGPDLPAPAADAADDLPLEGSPA